MQITSHLHPQLHPSHLKPLSSPVSIQVLTSASHLQITSYITSTSCKLCLTSIHIKRFSLKHHPGDETSISTPITPPSKYRNLCLSSNQVIKCTGARLDARTYTFAHPIWRTTNAARKQGAISPILPVFCRYYLCDAIMLIKLSMVWPWVTGITTLEVAIVVVNFARDARMNTVNVCRMRERIKQDARTSLLMRERKHIVHWGSFY